MSFELAGALGLAAALLALLGHIVLTLRAIHAEVRRIERRLEGTQDDAK